MFLTSLICCHSPSGTLKSGLGGLNICSPKRWAEVKWGPHFNYNIERLSSANLEYTKVTSQDVSVWHNARELPRGITSCRCLIVILINICHSATVSSNNSPTSPFLLTSHYLLILISHCSSIPQPIIMKEIWSFLLLNPVSMVEFCFVPFYHMPHFSSRHGIICQT